VLTGWCRSATSLAFTCWAFGCAARVPVAQERTIWKNVPAYMSPAPVGVMCGADRTDIQDTLTSVVDVLIDSLSDSGLSELLLDVSFAPKAEPGLTRPNISAGIVFPVEGRPIPREVMAGCAWSQGVTLRVNAASVRRAGLSIAATGPVRIAVRTIDGTVLTPPIVVESPSVPRSIQWRHRPRAT
jgi:hypothetical protein